MSIEETSGENGQKVTTEWMSVTDAAQYAGVTTATIYTALNKGKIEGNQQEGKWMVQKVSLADIKQRNERERKQLSQSLQARQEMQSVNMMLAQVFSHMQQKEGVTGTMHSMQEIQPTLREWRVTMDIGEPSPVAYRVLLYNGTITVEREKKRP